MNTAQFTIQEIKGALRRRWKLILISVLILTGISAGIAYMLPPKYASSISILVQKDETLNPLISYRMAVNMASEDRLKSFNQIIYSRSTVRALIDTLDLRKNLKPDQSEEQLLKKVKGDISTHLRASDSFDITYYNKDPKKAKMGVSFLADHFIKTRLKLDNRRNKKTVNFFKKKVNELEKAVGQRKKKMMSINKKSVSQNPSAKRNLQSRLENIRQDIKDKNLEIQKLKSQYSVIQAVNDSLISNAVIEKIYGLDLEGLPYGDKLQTLLDQYNQYKRKYTDRYPKVKKLKGKITDVAHQMPNAIQSDINTNKALKKELMSEREDIVSKLEQLTVSKTQNENKMSDYGIYQDLFNKMKVKLEQARTTRDLGKKASDQFVVIDPPVLPKKPAKPNRLLLILGGLGLGLIIGVLSASMAELLDTTIRKPSDLQLHEKPVIAYIPQKSH